jgi:hypothetical protein
VPNDEVQVKTRTIPPFSPRAKKKKKTASKIMPYGLLSSQRPNAVFPREIL